VSGGRCEFWIDHGDTAARQLESLLCRAVLLKSIVRFQTQVLPGFLG